MSTSPTGPAAPSPVSQSKGPGLSSVSTWRVGQVLAATVASNPQAGHAELRIGNLLVKAQTGEIPLTQGQTLRLEVASLKELPVLRLLSVLQHNPVTEALRTTLPRQQPLGPLLASLIRIASEPGEAARLGSEVARIAGELFRRLPNTEGVTQGAGLRQAIRDSGLFLEPKLAQASHPGGTGSTSSDIKNDLKGNLIRLVQVLRDSVAKPTASSTDANEAKSAPGNARGPTGALTAGPPLGGISTRLSSYGTIDPNAPLQRGQPPLSALSPAALNRAQLAALSQLDLQRQAEGALARVQLNQLSSLGLEPRALSQEWLIELPIRRDMDVDIWSLRISREGQSQNDDQDAANGSAWSVMLAFDLPDIGPMQTRLTLRGDKVAAQFFSQTQGVLPVLAEHLSILHARLQGVGLTVSDLTVHHGQIPSGAKEQGSRIVDERV